MNNINYRTYSGRSEEIVRKAILNSYLFMFAGLLLTAIVSFIVGRNRQLLMLVNTFPLNLVVMFAPIAVAFSLSLRILSISLNTAQLLFWSYAGLVGISLAKLQFMFRINDLAFVFLITSIMFLISAIYGHVTKSDLGQYRSFLMMGLIGLLISGIFGIFLDSRAFNFSHAVIGVILFTAFTAYDSYLIKNMLRQAVTIYGTEEDLVGKLSVLGALMLYVDFINLFIYLLRAFSLIKSNKDNE